MASETAEKTRSSNPGQNTSHPGDLKLMKKYAEDRRNELPQGLKNLATALKERLEQCLVGKKNEMVISSTLRDVLKAVWAKDPFTIEAGAYKERKGALYNQEEVFLAKRKTHDHQSL
eukprot:scaffold1878_cov104-Cylindrotheca_fusiformis.AAC.2